MRFSITFHTPFRVAVGDRRAEADQAVDPDLLLPATSMKGVMRAAAALVLPPTLVDIDQVFGAPSQPSPWSWSPIELDRVNVTTRSRVRIDETTGTAWPGGLFNGDEVTASGATFSVDAISLVPAETLERHEAVLAVAGAAVHHVGADRRRGLGWVTIRPHGVDPQASLNLLWAQ